MTQTRVQRPELTLPEAEGARLRAAYDAADVILEYGSGGSTVLASEMRDKRVFSVESDKNWADMMQIWLAENPPSSGTKVDVIWSNVGKTAEWGRPIGDGAWRRYPNYPLAIWQQQDFVQPDVVLVDGRFRPGCAMATAFCTARPVVMLVDDYQRRTGYHAIEEFLGSPHMIGRMAEFEVAPMAVPAHRLLPIIKMMMRP